jgi:hypothetical protein
MSERPASSGEFYVVRIFACPCYGAHRLIDDLRRFHAQLLFHMDGACRNERMHARRFGASHCLAAAAYVFLIRTCQTAYGTVAHRRRDCFDRLEITVASRRKSRFYYIDPHAFEMTRDTQLFFLRHRRARALLAIAHVVSNMINFSFFMTVSAPSSCTPTGAHTGLNDRSGRHFCPAALQLLNVCRVFSAQRAAAGRPAERWREGELNWPDTGESCRKYKRFERHWQLALRRRRQRRARNIPSPGHAPGGEYVAG